VEDESQQSILQSGTNIGELARQLFPNGVHASPPDFYFHHISVNLTSIICYYMSFEKSRITDLADIYPQCGLELLAINNRICDLMIPFQKRRFCHPRFGGSYSN